jgi:cytochrome c oxidase assembly factor CtaG
VTVLWIAVAAIWCALYQVAWRRTAARMRPWRRWCWAGAGVLMVLAGAAPLGHLATRQAWAEALQFSVLAFGVAPLAALGAPLGLRRRPVRTSRLAPRKGWGALAAFLVATVGWRLPAAVDAVATHRSLVVLEALTLVGASWPLWAALVGSPPAQALSQRPRRMALAALAAWSVWIFAYVVGFSSGPFYSVYAGRGAMDSLELGVGVLFALSGAALVPVVFVNLVRWLAADDLLGEATAVLHPRRAPGGGDRWVGGPSGG